MPINWRHRAPVLKVLAAVYAELGEEAFKGRYGGIAKLYGSEATYDAIKAFFAKEVVEMANQLKASSSSHVGGASRATFHAAVRRPVRIDFDEDDEEIVIMGENKRSTHDQSSQQDQTAIEARPSYDPVHDGVGFSQPPPPSRNGVMNTHRPRTQVTPGPSRQSRAHELVLADQQTSRKRSYSIYAASDILPSSFGYVTKSGQTRCALCMRELSSAAILKKHEAMSKLHLANLKDPDVVSRGRKALAQVYGEVDNPLRRHRNTTEPLVLDDLSEDIESPLKRRNTPGNLLPGHSEQQDRAWSDLELDSTFDTIELAVSNGKEKAREYQHCDTDRDKHGNEFNPSGSTLPFKSATHARGKVRAQSVPRDTSTATAMELPKPTQTLAPHDQPPATGLPAFPTVSDAMKDITPTLLAQIILSRGVELLAEKCVEEVPELRVKFLNHVKQMQSNGVNNGSSADRQR